MVEILNIIINSITNNKELSNNTLLNPIIENTKNQFNKNIAPKILVKDIKEKLIGVNEYLKSNSLKTIIESIDGKIEEYNKKNPENSINDLYNEFDLDSEIKIIMESDAYKSLPVKEFIDKFRDKFSFSELPSLKKLPEFYTNIKKFKQEVKLIECAKRIEKYMEDNREKLIVLETIHYLDMVSDNFYSPVTSVLKKIVLENKISASIMRLELKDHLSIPVVSEMLKSLEIKEQERFPRFNLGLGNTVTQVYNYIGPVLKESNSMILLIHNTFVELNEGKVDEKDLKYSKVFSKEGKVSLNELNTKYVVEKHSDYYNLTKSYHGLGFKMGKDGVSARFNNISMDFKIDENGALDLYVNNSKVEKIKDFDFNRMFVLENSNTKTNSANILNNLDKFYNMEFVKIIVNEKQKKLMYVVDVQDGDYYLYDIINETKRNIYKFNVYKLHSFILETTGYDIRDLFRIEINDVKSKLLGIKNKKDTYIQAINELESSIELVNETIRKVPSPVHENDLITLKDKAEKEINSLKDKILLLEYEEREISQSEDIDPLTAGGSYEPLSSDLPDPQVGDDVVLNNDQIVRIIGKNDINQEFVVLGVDNKEMTIKREDIKSIAFENPRVEDSNVQSEESVDPMGMPQTTPVEIAEPVIEPKGESMSEAREAGVEYSEVLVKGQVDKIVASVEKQKASAVTKMIKKYVDLDSDLKKIKAEKDGINVEIKKYMTDLFNASDEVFTRVIQTGKAIASLAKKTEDREVKDVDYKSVLETLSALNDELKEKIKKIAKKYTEVKTIKGKSPALRAEMVGEASVKGVIDAIVKGFKTFKTTIKDWASKFDTKLKDVVGKIAQLKPIKA